MKSAKPEPFLELLKLVLIWLSGKNEYFLKKNDNCNFFLINVSFHQILASIQTSTPVIS